MTLVFVIAALAVLCAIAMLAVGKLGQFDDSEPDRPTMVAFSDAVGREELGQVRFSIAFRGYRMSEVDSVLATLGRALELRDIQLASLRSQLEGESKAQQIQQST